MTGRTQYTVHQFQQEDRFVVRDSSRMWEPIMTDRGEKADNRNPGDLAFFGMDLAEAKILSAHLEASYRTV